MLNENFWFVRSSSPLIFTPSYSKGVCTRGVRVNAVDFGIVVNEFELQSCYYVHFQENNLGKGINSLILPAMG